MKAPFTGDAPDVTVERAGPRWERALQREQAIGPVTLGHHLYVPRRTLAQQVRILQRDKHPLAPSIPTLSAWRRAYLAGGRRVQALLDNDRGGKGSPRGWLGFPDNQALVVECEKRLIGTQKTEYPPAALLRAQLVGRLGAAAAKSIPGARALDRFRREGLSRAERAMLVGGDRRYRETVMPKPPTRRADSFGEIWTADHRKCDVLVWYGERAVRPWVTVIIDVYAKACVGLYPSPTDPGSTEIALALRDAILPKAEDPEGLLCGCPQSFYTDWGKDFSSVHLRAALADLGIAIQHAQPYSPWAKGDVEGNAFGTMSKQFDPTIPGSVGRNAIERLPDSKAVITFTDFAQRVRRWFLINFNQMVFQKKRLERRSVSRIDLARAHRIPLQLPGKDTLLLALMKRERRVVSSGGISLGGTALLWNEQSTALWALAEDRAEVELRYDPADMARAYVFHRGGFVCEVVDPRSAAVGLTERDVRHRMKLRGERLKALRDATREDRQAAMDPDSYLEHLDAQRTIEVPLAAVAGGGGGVRPIRQVIPALDRAAQQLRRPGRPSSTRLPVAARPAPDRLPDLADKPLPDGWEK